MRARVCIVAILVMAGLAFVLPGRQAEGRALLAGGSWKLTSSTYPAHTQVKALQPTNANADAMFGRFHRNSYEELGRIDGRGWLQVAALTKAVGTTKHTLTWGYLVSYFPT